MMETLEMKIQIKDDVRRAKSPSIHSLHNKINYEEEVIDEGPTYNLLPLSHIGQLFFLQNKVTTQSFLTEENINNEFSNKQFDEDANLPKFTHKTEIISDDQSKSNTTVVHPPINEIENFVIQRDTNNTNQINQNDSLSFSLDKQKFSRIKLKRSNTHAITKQEKYTESKLISQKSSKFLLYFHDDDAKRRSLKEQSTEPDNDKREQEYVQSPTIKNTNQDKKKKGKPYEIFFRTNQFVEFFCYNFLFFICFGPLTPILLCLFCKQNLNLSKNLGFYGLDIQNIKQLFYYLTWCASIILYINLPNSDIGKNIIIELAALMMIKVLFHCIKFGYFHPSVIMKFKEKGIDNNLKDKYQIFKYWMTQTEEIIDIELENAKARQEIEASTFYFEFIVKPSEEKLKPLICTERIQNISLSDNTKFNLQELPYGMNLAKQLILFYNQRHSYKWIFIVAGLISFIRNISCRFFLLPDPNQWYYLENYSLITISFFVITTYLLFWLWFTALAFIMLFVHDLQRKLFLMNQMSQLISPKKVDNEENHTKIYPTLTLTCAITMQTWGRLRRLLLDYGQVYTIRLTRMISLVLVIYGIGLIFAVLSIFGIIPNLLNFSIRLTIKMGIDMLYLTIFLVKSILIGAKINESFKIHKLLLFKNKIIFDEITYNFESFKCGVVQPNNPLYKKLIQSITDIQKIFNLNQQATEQYIKGIQRLFTIQLQELDLFERHSPFKVLSIAMTNDLAIKILASFCSVVGTICISYYSKFYN